MSSGWAELPLEGARVRIEGAADRSTVIVRRSDNARVGTIVVTDESDWLFVESLEIEQSLRGYGLGGEAAGLVREAAARQRRILRAWAPPDNGLAVYFWVRVGLRPLPGEGPNGGLWFERNVR